MNTRGLTQFGSAELASVDQAITESRISRLAHLSFQIGGVAVFGLASHELAQSLDQSALPEFGWMAAGLMLHGLGMRLGIERGAAVQRHEQREIMDGACIGGMPPKNLKEELTLSIGTLGNAALITTAMLTGIESGVDDSLLRESAAIGYDMPDALIPLTAILAVGVSMATERAGRHRDSLPVAHRLLRIAA